MHEDTRARIGHLSWREALGTEEFLHDLRAIAPEMRGDGRQNGAQGADAQVIVRRDRDMVLAPLVRGEPEMTPGLPRHRIAVAFESARERPSGEITRESHRAARGQAAMISSWTRCSRMTCGRSASSK